MNVEHVNVYSKAMLRLDATYNFKQLNPTAMLAKVLIDIGLFHLLCVMHF